MITEAQKEKLLSTLRACTLSDTINQRSKLPIVISGKDTFIVSARKDNVLTDDNNTINNEEIFIVDSELLNSDPDNLDDVILLNDTNIQYKVLKCRLVNSQKFHYDDKWYYYKYSVDEPEFNFGIIKVSYMPYNSFENKLEKRSFISTAYSLIRQGYCRPFMIFINGKFVNLNYVNVIFDCGDTYLLLYGDKYNYYELDKADIHMIILPFDIDYMGEESESYFSMMLSITKKYIQDVFIPSSLNIFDINTIYNYRGMIYNIGGWLYSQLRNYHLGLLSNNRISKLKNTNVINGHDILDLRLYSINTYYNSIYTLSNTRILDNILFRFDTEGILHNDYGDNIIAIVNPENISKDMFTGSDDCIYHINKSNTTLIRENYIVFKNGLFFPDCIIEDRPLNSIIINNPDKLFHRVYILYNELYNKRAINHTIHFDKEYISNLALDYIKGTCNNPDKISYFENSIKYLDINGDDPLQSIIKYDPTLLNELYSTNVESIPLTGDKVNSCIKQYNGVTGLMIGKNKYQNHESYILIFEDGELIEEYSKMIVYSNFFFIPMERLFNSDSQIELLYFNGINNNEIKCKLSDIIESTSSVDYDRTFIGYHFSLDEIKLFYDYPEEILEYKNIIEASENIAFNISYRDENNNFRIIDSILNNQSDYKEFTLVSKNKFIYQRLYVDQKAYRLLLGNQFKYCDNQKQYMVFINGRRMNDDSFIITIPKYSRPFWNKYIYISKYVNPEDRIEVFYLPNELTSFNSELNENGYANINKTRLEVPYDPRLYLLFINGKKIPYNNIISIDSHTFRITKDTLSTNNLVVIPVYNDILPEVKQYFNNNELSSDYDGIIEYIKNTESLGYSELDKLFNTSAQMSNIEDDKTKQDIGRIAIINEIVRDFWVTSGYQYNEMPIIYDFETNEFTYENGDIIVPAMDATQSLNIIKE